MTPVGYKRRPPEEMLVWGTLTGSTGMASPETDKRIRTRRGSTFFAERGAPGRLGRYAEAWPDSYRRAAWQRRAPSYRGSLAFEVLLRNGGRNGGRRF